MIAHSSARVLQLFRASKIIENGANIILGMVFWLAATDKAIHANDSMMAISTALRVKFPSATAILMVLISVEYALGWSLLFVPSARPIASLLTVGLLVLFLVYLGLLYHHPTSNCGCGDWITFGRNLREKILFSMVRNILLLGIAVYLIRRNPQRSRKPFEFLPGAN